MKLTLKQGKNNPDVILDIRYNDSIENILALINQVLDKEVSVLYNKHGKIIPVLTPIRGEIIVYSHPPTQYSPDEDNQ